MSTLTELGNYLEAHGCGSQSANPPSLQLGSRDDTPDTCLAIYQYPGGRPEYVQEQDMPSTEKPQIQVVARAVSYAVAGVLADRAWQFLSIVRNQRLDGVYYRKITPNGSPAFLGRDPKDRVLIFFNASVEKEVSLVSVS